MITTADVLEIMAVIGACHQRSAPRLDDREVAMATASVWAELLNEYDFEKAELVAAVKHRAKVNTEAPEVADIIRVARGSRSEEMARTPMPSNDGLEHYPGDSKAAPDLPEFPAEWDEGQRTSVYWYALRLHAAPHSTAGWEAIAAQLEQHRAKGGAE